GKCRAADGELYPLTAWRSLLAPQLSQPLAIVDVLQPFSHRCERHRVLRIEKADQGRSDRNEHQRIVLRTYIAPVLEHAAAQLRQRPPVEIFAAIRAEECSGEGVALETRCGGWGKHGAKIAQIPRFRQLVGGHA